MSAVYITEPGGQTVTYPEDRVRSLWNEGHISPKALCWTEGMPDWRPAPEFFGTKSRAATGPRVRKLAEDPTTLTLVLKTMLWVSIGMSVLGVISSCITLAFGTTRVVQILFLLGHVAVFVATGVVFLMWIYRANCNARSLRAKDMEFTPGWAVGWYFIPVANLWKPYEAMKEIWQATHNPDSWTSDDEAKPISIWWALWLLSNFLGQASLRLSWGDSLVAGEVAGMLKELADIALCYAAIRMVTLTCQRQCEWTRAEAG